MNSKTTAPAKSKIETGDRVRPVYLSIDKDGESSLIASDEKDDLLNLTADVNIGVGRIDVAAGKYLIGFTVTDFADNTNEEFAAVTV